MAYKYDPTIELNVKKLIGVITKFDEGTEIFNYVLDHFLKSLYQGGSALCATENEVNTKINSLADKFRFHGHLQAADIFIKLYKEFIGSNPSQDELQNKLNVVQLLLNLSVSPTSYLLTLPSDYQSEVLSKIEEITDWKAYLLEGIEWNPVFSDSDESDYDDDIDSQGSINDVKATNQAENESKHELPQEKDTSESQRKALCSKVQNSWWNDPFYRQIPPSDHPQANIALRWENYLSEVSHGLLGGPTNKILSEYKVIREIIWQQYNPHNSVVFAWNGEEVLANENVTIASLRPFVFKNLIEAFLPDIMMLHKLRNFHHNVINDDSSPKTYWGYAEAMMGFLRAAEAELISLELLVMKQETTMTIIKLGNRLKFFYKDLKYLYMLHSSMILDYNKHPPDVCCIVLLTNLYNELYNVFEKYQMDIVLTLYMESTYKYVRIIQDWLRTDVLFDNQNEFPIKLQEQDAIVETISAIGSSSSCKKKIFDRATYVPREIPPEININVDRDPLMSLIYKEVLQFGRHIHLFSLLGKLNLLHGTNFSIYDEWLEAVLHSLGQYFPGTKSIDEDEDAHEENPVPVLDKSTEFSEMCQDFCRKSLANPCLDETQRDTIATCNGFLMTAFSDLFQPINHKPQPRKRPQSTFKKISSLTRNTFPGVQFYLTDSFRAILKSKYQDCGAILKNLFKHEYLIGEHVEVLCKVFLFKDDFIFTFYRKQFQKIESNSNWGNDIWLTYELQDIVRDVHPQLYENIIVSVKPGWQHLLEDPLKTCTLLNVKYKITWPIDVIVTERQEKMYREMFYFILKIKWALYTLNHLQYSRLEQKKRHIAPKCVKVLFQRLEVLRFGFTNVFAALQHYILGYVWYVFDMNFRKGFDAAMDLDSLIESHQEFIFGFHRAVARVRDYQEKSYGFDWALYSVRQLRKMWLAPRDVIDHGLRKIEDGLQECHKNIFEVISEHHVTD